MTMTQAARRGLNSTSRTFLLLLASIVVAVALNAAIAAGAIAAGAPADYGPLSVPAQALFTVLGIVAGWIGWRVVHACARDPRRVLRVLVPVVVALSLIPDILLLVFPVIPGTNVAAVVALMLMHVVVATCGVVGFAVAERNRGR